MTEIEQRREAASAHLAVLKLDALLVSSSASVRYLTDYSGSNGLVLLTRGESHFFTDPRYGLEAQQKISCRVHVAKKGLIPAAVAVLKRKKLKKIGFETAWLPFEEYAQIKDELPLGFSLQPVGRVLEEQRMVKSPAEADRIRRSVALNSQAFSSILKRIQPGVTEQGVAAALDYEMRCRGAEKPAFETIVAVGDRTALPHAHPTARPLGSNELLLIDMGATLGGYASDMTRMIFCGSAPRKVRDLYRAVLEAQLAAIDAVRPGITAGKVDAAARGVLRKHGLDRAFLHSTGHGLGLEIHEPPRIGRRDQTVLRPGMAITIEPGAYLPELGGVRIEDTVLVTASGCEVLTPTPKELFQI